MLRYLTRELTGSLVNDLHRTDLSFLRAGGKTAGYGLDLVNERYFVDRVSKSFADAVTFSRAGNATMVDSDGALKWAPHNLLTYSEEFDNAAWLKSDMTVTADAATAPDGTLAACALVDDATNDVHFIAQTNVFSDTSVKRMNAVWVKQGTLRYVSVTAREPNGISSQWNNIFDTQDGVWTTTGGNGVGDFSATDAGNGWWLIEFSDTTDSAAYDGLFIGTSSGPDSGDQVYSGSGGTIYIWGAHIYRSDLGGMVDNPDRGDSYVPTTSAARYLPRLGHHVWDGSQWVNKGLLLESEARTNLILNSDTLEQKEVYVTDQEYTLSFNSGSQFKSEIMEDIAATAVDVFIYDTSKDSDGGAWRTGALAQASSWYNETLNTATRGSRREFPAVAVIVAESDTVTIYDGDDPALPMWMVFNSAAANLFVRDDITSVAAAEGVLSIGMTNGGLLSVANFTTDFAIQRFDGVADPRVWTSIADRYETLSFTVDDSYDSIVDRNVNDVAMTVLPDSPIDPATGLPVPTIAVATDGGVSVIKDDGTVVDSASTLAFGFVVFDDESNIWAGRNVANHTLMFSTQADYEASDGFGDIVAETASAIAWEFPLLVRSEESDFGNNILSIGGRSATGHAVAGLMLHQPNYTDQSKGMSALLTSTYNTGWQVVAIKGAFLSDTDDTDLVATDTIADRSVNGLTLTLGDACTVEKVADGAELVWFTFAANETVTLGSDITSSGSLVWWEKIVGEAVHHVLNYDGSDSYVDGEVGTPPTTGVEISGTTLTFKAGATLALVRPSGTPVSTSQVQNVMYPQEVKLFEENAAATLHGTSDAVTALAHDPDTDLLHVGTSAGRSVFDGLRRVDNTTDAITTAISAVGGFIAEE